MVDHGPSAVLLFHQRMPEPNNGVWQGKDFLLPTKHRKPIWGHSFKMHTENCIHTNVDLTKNNSEHIVWNKLV